MLHTKFRQIWMKSSGLDISLLFLMETLSVFLCNFFLRWLQNVKKVFLFIHFFFHKRAMIMSNINWVIFRLVYIVFELLRFCHIPFFVVDPVLLVWWHETNSSICTFTLRFSLLINFQNDCTFCKPFHIAFSTWYKYILKGTVSSVQRQMIFQTKNKYEMVSCYCEF